ncbi:MAG: hypothetical protein JST86_06980 [Bacteroidetes bacterium]|nr:hypothetical protein [Bacteroidota bacterium]
MKELYSIKENSIGDIIYLSALSVGFIICFFLWNIITGIVSLCAGVLFFRYLLKRSSVLFLFEDYFIIKPQYFNKDFIREKHEYSDQVRIRIHQSGRAGVGSSFAVGIIATNGYKEYGFQYTYNKFFVESFQFLDKKGCKIYLDDSEQAENIFKSPVEDLKKVTLNSSWYYYYTRKNSS